MYKGLILLLILFIALDYSLCSLAGISKSAPQCRCQSGDDGCKLNVSCLSCDTNTYWIGLINTGFGWFENTRNCSDAEISSLGLIPKNDSCSQSLSTYNFTLNTVSGKEQEYLSNIFDTCSSSPDFFIVQFFCVPIKTNSNEDIIIGETCRKKVQNTQSVRIYSKDFPHESIKTTFPSCDCKLSTNASVLVVQTYDNRLYDNQTLALTHKNGTVIKQWKKPRNVDEMLGNDTIRVSNSELLLQWNNKASTPAGKVWIVIEVSNDAEYISVVCDQNTSTTSSSMTETLTTTTTTTADAATTTADAATTTTRLLNTTQELSTSTAEIWNSSYFSKSLTSLIEMNITSTSPTQDSTHLTRSSTTSVSNITHPTKSLTSGTSNLAHTTKSLTSGTSNLTHTTKSLTSGTLNITQTTKSLTTGLSSLAHLSEGTKNPSSNGKVNHGIIIGAVCAILLFLFILILCLVICCKKKKQPQQVNPTPTQPSNSRFNKIHDARENPGRTEDKTLNNKTNKISPATNSFSILSEPLPPLPVGRHVNQVSIIDGLRNFNENESSDEEENEERYNNIFGNYPRKTDENTYTESVERETAKDPASSKHESFEMKTGKDANSDSGKKWNRKKKSWPRKKKQKKAEALLDENKETQDSYNLREGEESVLSDC